MIFTIMKPHINQLLMFTFFKTNQFCWISRLTQTDKADGEIPAVKTHQPRDSERSTMVQKLS